MIVLRCIIELIVTAFVSMILFGVIAFALTGCGHTQIGLVIVNAPALVDVSTKDEVATEVDSDSSTGKHVKEVKASLY